MTSIRAFFLEIRALFFQFPKKDRGDLRPFPLPTYAPATFHHVPITAFYDSFCYIMQTWDSWFTEFIGFPLNGSENLCFVQVHSFCSSLLQCSYKSLNVGRIWYLAELPKDFRILPFLEVYFAILPSEIFVSLCYNLPFIYTLV